jgi:hypothetical protein
MRRHSSNSKIILLTPPVLLLPPLLRSPVEVTVATARSCWTDTRSKLITLPESIQTRLPLVIPSMTMMMRVSFGFKAFQEFFFLIQNVGAPRRASSLPASAPAAVVHDDSAADSAIQPPPMTRSGPPPSNIDPGTVSIVSI